MAGVRGAGVGLWSAGAGGDGQVGRIDRSLENLKRAVMNEIELEFSWYCREKKRSRQEMEAWWDERGNLVDALCDDPWPAWGTAEAFERCRRLCASRRGGGEGEGEDEERLRPNPEAKAEKSQPKISVARVKTQGEVGERTRVEVAGARPR